MSTNDKAKELAIAFLKEIDQGNQALPSPQQYSFDVLDASMEKTGETIIVTVAYKSPNLKKSIVSEKRAGLNNVSFFGPGRPCPTCNGTGSL
jgi:hypothetical protein